MSTTVWTIGHSTRSPDELLALLRAHGVTTVADVRRFPGSRRQPQLARERLEPWLRARGIDYEWFPDLGGRRTPREGSPNLGWRVAGFRGYADHMASPEFAAAFARLRALAQARPTALLCAEALWWRCHRRLLADALAASGDEVRHIQTATRAPIHRIAPPARLEGGRLTYPAERPRAG